MQKQKLCCWCIRSDFGACTSAGTQTAVTNYKYQFALKFDHFYTRYLNIYTSADN